MAYYDHDDDDAIVVALSIHIVPCCMSSQHGKQRFEHCELRLRVYIYVVHRDFG